jgi:hypothetical protein
LQAAQNREAGLRLGDPPLLGERLLQAAQIARGVVHVGFAHFDIIEAHDRIDFDRMSFRALAHHLAVDLRFLRHIDDQVAAKARLAAKAASRGERPASVPIAPLDLVAGRDVIWRGSHAMFGEFAFQNVNLAAPAQAAAAADRIEIDAKFARRFQDAQSFSQASPLARWREDDERIVQPFPPQSGCGERRVG